MKTKPLTPAMLATLKLLNQGRSLFRGMDGVEYVQVGLPGAGGQIGSVRKGTIRALVERMAVEPSGARGTSRSAWVISAAGREALAASYREQMKVTQRVSEPANPAAYLGVAPLFATHRVTEGR